LAKITEDVIKRKQPQFNQGLLEKMNGNRMDELNKNFQQFHVLKE
jgi:hypothetical protein